MSKLYRQNYLEKKWVFRPAKLCREKYVETTKIFQPVKLHGNKKVETTWILWSSKLRWKKVCGNDVDFSTIEMTSFCLRSINVISTWNRR